MLADRPVAPLAAGPATEGSEVERRVRGEDVMNRIIFLSEEDHAFMCSLFGELDSDVPTPDNFSSPSPSISHQSLLENQEGKPTFFVLVSTNP